MEFKDWFYKEDQTQSLKPSKKQHPENNLDGMWRELGIDPNLIPQFIESGPIELEDQGLWFNQSVWEVIKPIRLDDYFVRIKFHKSLSPNLNQRCYIKNHDGKMVPYKAFNGELESKIFLIPINKFSKMLGRGWEMAIQQPSPMGM